MPPPHKAIGRYRRTKLWDYGRGASLFITIATAPRRALFGRVVGAEVELSPLGRIVLESLELMPALNPGVRLYGHVVMPDHIHFNVYLEPGLAEPLKILGKAIGRFKVYTTKQAKLMGLAGLSPALNAGARADGRAEPGLLWQQGYHDRLCLTRAMIDATERYIAYNPLKWTLMYGAAGALRLAEPLDSPRLDAGDYWKGVGNVSLLNDRICSLRVSRQVRSPAAIAALVSRLRNATQRGYTILSGFISPGEKAVRDMLCATPGARFIRILPSCLPNARYKPESRYVTPFAEDRYLEIARGNDEVGFSRAACLDCNDEIVRIAAAGEGLSLYWKPDGPRRIELETA